VVHQALSSSFIQELADFLDMEPCSNNIVCDARIVILDLGDTVFKQGFFLLLISFFPVLIEIFVFSFRLSLLFLGHFLHPLLLVSSGLNWSPKFTFGLLLGRFITSLGYFIFIFIVDGIFIIDEIHIEESL
jgi:hypothetical protein